MAEVKRPLRETRPYDYFRVSVAPTVDDRHSLRQGVEESSSAEMLVSRLASEGITHVVLNIREIGRLGDAYGILSFSGGEEADAHERRLAPLPEALEELLSVNGVDVFEVPRALEARQGGSTMHIEGPTYQEFAPRPTREELVTTHPLRGERR